MPSEKKQAPKPKPAAAKPDPKAAEKKASAKPDGAKPGGATLVATSPTGAPTRRRAVAERSATRCRSRRRDPSANLKDTKAYLFVSFRPAEKVSNEIAAVLNFKTKEDGPSALVIGSTSYDLVTRGENAWIATASDEPTAIGALSKGGSATVQATSARGTKVNDRYSLSGFGQALERAKRDCQ